MRSRPGTGMSPPLCDTQFSCAVCAVGILKYACCVYFLSALIVRIVLPPISIMLVAWHIRRRAAAPLIGEHDLLAVVAEDGRVPEREVRVGLGVEAHRLLGIRDVDEQAVAAARAGEQVHRRIRRHVVAVARTGRRRRRRSVVSRRRAATSTAAAATRRDAHAPRSRRRRRVREDARARHDLGLLRMRERHLDDVEPDRASSSRPPDPCRSCSPRAPSPAARPGCPTRRCR